MPLADTEMTSSLPTRDGQKEQGHEDTPSFPPPNSSTAAVVPPVAAAAAVAVGSAPPPPAAEAKGAVSEEDLPGTTKTAEGLVTTTTNSHDASTKGTKSVIESTETKIHNGNNNVNDSKHPKQQTANLIKKRPEPPQMSPSQSQQEQQEHITICLPIVYGSVAFALPKAEEYNTHQWTLYVRGPNHEDLSHGIAKVVFQLHPSFAQPIREITAPPFEVTEKGWGEFEASIRIVWRDPSEKALVLMHMIKLYPPLPTATTAGLEEGQGVSSAVPGGGGTSGGKNSKDEIEPVIHEYYDEVVFTNPTESFQKHLLSAGKTWMSSTSSSLPNSLNEGGEYPKVFSNEPDVQKSFRSYSDQEEFKQLLEAYKFLEQELQAVKDRILLADCHRNELEKALAAVTVKAKSMVAVPAPAPAPAAAVSAPVAAPVKRKASKTSGAGGNSKKVKRSSGTRTPPPTNATGVTVAKSAGHHRNTNKSKNHVLPSKATLNTGAPTAAPASGILPNTVESTSVVGARPSLTTDMASTVAVSIATTSMPNAAISPTTTVATTTTTSNVPTTTPANMPSKTSSASTSK
jgi:Transcription initiation factor IIF, auxiliary subunit